MAANLAERAPAEARARPVINGKRGSPVVVHAAPPVLDPALGGDAALRRIGLAGLDHLSRNEPAALAGMPGGIHQMRVAIRRLRAILSGFADRLPDYQRHWASEELRWLAGALGPARNLDVFDSVLLKPAQRAAIDPPAFEPLCVAVERRRRAAHRDAASAIRSDRYASLLAHLFCWFETFGWRQEGLDLPDQPIGDIAARSLQRRWRSARKRGKGFAAQSPLERHRLRISLKKLRYIADAVSSLYPAENIAPFAARLKRLQDELGHANDVALGQEILAGLAVEAGDDRFAEAGRRMLAWHEARLVEREPKLRKQLRELLDNEPFWRC